MGFCGQTPSRSPHVCQVPKTGLFSGVLVRCIRSPNLAQTPSQDGSHFLMRRVIPSRIKCPSESWRIGHEFGGDSPNHFVTGFRITSQIRRCHFMAFRCSRDHVLLYYSEFQACASRRHKKSSHRRGVGRAGFRLRGPWPIEPGSLAEGPASPSMAAVSRHGLAWAPRRPDVDSFPETRSRTERWLPGCRPEVGEGVRK